MFWSSQRVFLMGVLNTTPDSFYDGGRHWQGEKALNWALEMVQHGADVVDVGGESTRPGAKPISVEEELNRVLPVLKSIRQKVSVPLSLDTSKAAVVREAVAIGAVDLVNDVTALNGDPEMARVVAQAGLPVLLMHMRGTPSTMQENPVYTDVVAEVAAFFEERIDFARAQGIAKKNILIDPGIGFGKTLEHNLQLLNRLEELTKLGFPVVVGTSRKSFIGAALENLQADRIWGTAATVAAAVLKGARGVRVHDVAEMRQVASVAEKIRAS